MKSHEARTATFCVVCHAILSKTVARLHEGLNETLEHQPTLSDLEAASASGCHICIKALKVFTSPEAAAWLEAVPFTKVNAFCSRGILKLNVHPCGRTNSPVSPSHEYVDYIILDSSIESTGNFGLPLPGDGGRAELASAWLQNCLQNHPKCHSDRDTEWFPSRLLDLADGEVRLLLTTEERPKSKDYATLSYCWGPNPNFLRLTSSNLADFRSKVPFEQLPKTLQDAVTVTRELGIIYLWIDSLCIIQSGEGSADDWDKECKEMEHIYANGTVNIAASGAANPRGGLFINRGLKMPTIVNIDGKDYLMMDADIFDGIFRSTISTRAWCVQERLLSRRMLHFGREQMFWECGELAIACEDMKSGFKSKDLPSLEFWKNPFSLEVPQDQVLRHCERIFNYYARCDLSHPQKDKFAALSGVANRLTQVLQQDYIAGFFRDTLPLSLCWKNRSSSRAQPCTGLYRAPTWSWANINGPVEIIFTRSILKCFATVVNISVQTSGSRLLGARLVLDGTLIPAYATDKSLGADNCGFPYRKRGDDTFGNFPKFYLDSPNFSHAASDCYFLPIMLDDFDEPGMEGIVLAKNVLPDFSGSDTYSRIGAFEFFSLSPEEILKLEGLPRTHLTLI